MQYYSDYDSNNYTDSDDENINNQELEEELLENQNNDIYELYKIIQEFREKENPFILNNLKLIDFYKFIEFNNPNSILMMNKDINCNKNLE